MKLTRCHANHSFQYIDLICANIKIANDFREEEEQKKNVAHGRRI